MTDDDFDNLREIHGGRCTACFSGIGEKFEGICGDISDSVEIMTGGMLAETSFMLRVKKSALYAAGVSNLRELIKKTVALTFDNEPRASAQKFVVLSVRAHPASALVHLNIRER